MPVAFSKCRAWDMWKEFGCRSAGEHHICVLDGAVVFHNVWFFKLVIEIWALNSFTELSGFQRSVLVFSSDVFVLENKKELPACLWEVDEKKTFACFFGWLMKFCQNSTKNLENRRIPPSSFWFVLGPIYYRVTTSKPFMFLQII